MEADAGVGAYECVRGRRSTDCDCVCGFMLRYAAPVCWAASSSCAGAPAMWRPR